MDSVFLPEDRTQSRLDGAGAGRRGAEAAVPSVRSSALSGVKHAPLAEKFRSKRLHVDIVHRLISVDRHLRRDPSGMTENHVLRSIRSVEYAT